MLLGDHTLVDSRMGRKLSNALTGPDGALIGTVTPDGAGNALLAGASGALLATLHGHPSDRRHEPYWPHALTDAAGGPLGTFTVIRTSSNIDWLGDVINVTVWWGRPGGPLKVPTIGVTLQLDHPVEGVLGDVLLLAMIDSAGATRDHLITSLESRIAPATTCRCWVASSRGPTTTAAQAWSAAASRSNDGCRSDR